MVWVGKEDGVVGKGAGCRTRTSRLPDSVGESRLAAPSTRPRKGCCDATAPWAVLANYSRLQIPDFSI